MKRTTLLSAGIIAAMLPNASFAECPDQTVACIGIDDQGKERTLQYSIVNFKSVKLDTSSATKFFDSLGKGLSDKFFQCKPCVEGCGDGVNNAIAKCDQKAKDQGLVAGYLDPNGLTGPSVTSVITDTLKVAKDVAETAAQVRAAAGK